MRGLEVRPLLEVPRSERESLLKGAMGLGLSPEGMERSRELGPWFRVGRNQLGGPLEGRHGLFCRVGGNEGQPKVQVKVGRVGGPLGAPGQLPHAFAGLSHLHQADAKPVAGPPIPRKESRSLSKGGDGFADAPG